MNAYLLKYCRDQIINWNVGDLSRSARMKGSVYGYTRLSCELIQPFVLCDLKILIKFKHVHTPWPRKPTPWNLARENICTCRQGCEHKKGHFQASKSPMHIYVNKNIWNNRLLAMGNSAEVLKARLRREFAFSLAMYVCITWNFIMNKAIQ